MTTKKLTTDLEARLNALRSKQKWVGPWRAAGIQRSIDNIRNRIALLNSTNRGSDEPA